MVPDSSPFPHVTPGITLGITLGNLTVTTLFNNCIHSDDDFKYRAYTYTYLLVFPVAFLSNGGALVVFLFLSPRRSASSVLMTNLALSDASFSLTLPLRLAYYFQGAHWNFPDWLCRMCVFCFYLNLYTSVLFLTGLSVLRWLAVLRPLQHRSQATPTRASLACLAVWLFVGGASVPFLLQGVKERAGLPRCFEPSGLSSWERVFALNYVALALGFLLPFLTLLSCHGSIVRRLRASTSRLSLRRRGRESRSVRLVSMVTVTFLLCFLPYHVARTVHLHAIRGVWPCGTMVTVQRVLVVTLCLATGNSVLNPLLYYLASSAFRTSISSAPLWRSRNWSMSTSSFTTWKGNRMAVRERRYTHTHQPTHTPTHTHQHTHTHMVMSCLRHTHTFDHTHSDEQLHTHTHSRPHRQTSNHTHRPASP
ncbi:cysteinyl leukotriene receptor 1 [Osmerus mordax]|uniref:cysteinyl leukotriene receptor 1 n=1 Tax=Osmerus mordax TaxID=8014 RepID=UPI00350F07ED